MMSAKKANSLARCKPTRRGNNHEPPPSSDIPRLEKICEKHGLTEHSLRKDGRIRCKKCSVDAVLKRRNEIREINDNGHFNINLLIDVCENSYYVSKSKPLNFKRS